MPSSGDSIRRSPYRSDSVLSLSSLIVLDVPLLQQNGVCIDRGHGWRAFGDMGNTFQRADKELKAPPALRGSAMVARPTRPQIFAVTCTARVCHDRSAAPARACSSN